MKINFDTIVSATEQKYDKLEIDVTNEKGETELVVFSNPARLKKEQREDFQKYVKQISEDSEENSDKDALSALQGILRSTCSTGNADVLFNIIGDDQALWSELVTSYFEAVKVGEASASQN